MNKTTLYLVRHGEPAEEFQNRFYGQIDVPLSERGKQQSRATADRLSTIPFDAVYSSDLQRAGYLADRLAEPLNLPVRRLAVFRERCYGIFQGLTEDEIRERHPELYPQWWADRISHPVQGGENFEQLRDRVLPGVRNLVESFPGGRIALAAHGGPIRVVLADVLGLPLANVFHFALDYACVNVVEYSFQGRPRLKLLNG
jgi:broad specificity phosphatase PhoE